MFWRVPNCFKLIFRKLGDFLTGALVLCSLNPITKETAIVAMILGRPSPDPGLGPSIELCSRHAPGLVDLSRIGKTLARQRIAAKEPPPALLQVEPSLPLWE
jgi:hypothetical protein